MEIKSLTITNNKILQIRVPKADRAKQQNTQRIFFANQDDWYIYWVSYYFRHHAITVQHSTQQLPRELVAISDDERPEIHVHGILPRLGYMSLWCACSICHWPLSLILPHCFIVFVLCSSPQVNCEFLESTNYITDMLYHDVKQNVQHSINVFSINRP